MRSIILCSTLALALPPCALLAQSTRDATLEPAAQIAFSSPPFSFLPAQPSAAAQLFAGLGIAAAPIPHCPTAVVEAGTPTDPQTAAQPCLATPTPYRRFLDGPAPAPLTVAQKAHLAVHNLFDPGNLATILGTSAYTIGSNAHTAYGPGFHGFARNAGISFSQDATGEFFGVFLIPSLTREDPHYHRMPQAALPRRFVHAIAHTVLSQHDDGSWMPNYASLLTYPISAEISNLYVPGVRDNGPSTVARIMTGYATDPIDNLITEFLPDVARHIHIRVIFVQRILNQVSSDEYSLP